MIEVRKIKLGKMEFVKAFRIRQMVREMRSTVAVVLEMFLALLVFMISNVTCGLNLNVSKQFFVIIYAVIILLYLLINKILVKRLDKYTPAEILKNRE